MRGSAANVRHLHGDRAVLSDHAAEFAAFRPDSVLDMGAMSETDARRTVEVFRDLVERAVMVSSIDVYQGFAVVTGAATDGLVPVPLTEESMPREQRSESPDSYDKLRAEQVFQGCRELRATVLRLPMVYGPGDTSAAPARSCAPCATAGRRSSSTRDSGTGV